MKQKFIIEIEYGSDFEKRAWSEITERYFTALKSMIEEKNKKNKLDFYEVEFL